MTAVRAATAAVLLLLVVAVVLVVAPDLVGLHGTTPFAQVVALRGPVGAALALVGLALLVPRRRSLVPFAVVLLLGAVTQAAVLAQRGLGPGEASAAARPSDAVTVLVLNTQGRVGPEALATLVVAQQADVAVLPETLRATAERAAALAAEQGRDLQALADDGAGGTVGATALLVDSDLGTYVITDHHPGPMASFTARGDGAGPVVAAVHPYPPLPGDMDTWRTGTATAVGVCATTADVVAGDFNATLDHPALATRPPGCADAAEGRAAASGTWPSTWPRALSAPIDHVLVDEARWAVHAVTVLDAPAGTDHRGLVAVLVPASARR